MVNYTLKNYCGFISLSPNQSANWRQTKCFVAVATAFIIVIAIAWSSLGFWMVLPFAGIEITLLTYLMYRTSQATYRKQVIMVDRHNICVEAGTHAPQSRYVLARAKTRAQVHVPEHPIQILTVFLCHDDIELELGAFLNHEDKTKLIDLLRDFNVRIVRRKVRSSVSMRA